MERFDPERVARRSRRAYELARVRVALRATAPFGAPFAIAVAHVGTWQAASLALAAFTAMVVGRSLGRAIGRGVRTGAMAGLVALLFPIVVNLLGHHCAGCAPVTPMPLCLAACAGGGALASFLSGRGAAGLRSVEAGAALATAGLVGAVGCLTAGGFGLLGLAGGMVLGGVPAVWVRATR